MEKKDILIHKFSLCVNVIFLYSIQEKDYIVFDILLTTVVQCNQYIRHCHIQDTQNLALVQRHSIAKLNHH